MPLVLHTLNYIYLESSDYRTIDLQVSNKLGEELAKLHGSPPELLDDPGDKEARHDGEDEPTYKLEWYPYDGYSQKWYDVDGFVSWVSAFCTGGQLFQITQEDGGGLWGWEVSEGRFRELELRSKGRWRKSTSSKTA